ncbi:MAG: hypothetical protein ACOVT5_16655 [Armatimonadaceae bacterium]
MNDEVLPGDYHAVTHRRADDPDPNARVHLGPKPTARFVQTAHEFGFALRSDTLVVRREQQTVAVIEFASPGLRESGDLRRKFLADACYLLNHDIHLLVVDLFPPTPAVPVGLPALVWDEFTDRPFGDVRRPTARRVCVRGRSPDDGVLGTARRGRRAAEPAHHF